MLGVEKIDDFHLQNSGAQNVKVLMIINKIKPKIMSFPQELFFLFGR